jgi:hypothetical protein
MAANPNDGLLKKIKYMEENGVPLEEQLDVAAEELNYRVRNNLSASYKNSAWHIVKMVAEKILAAGKKILKYIYRPMERIIANRLLPRNWHTSREVAAKENNHPEIKEERIIYANGVQPKEHGVNQVYLLRLIKDNGEFVWTKIGETMQKSTDRFKQILREMWKHGIRKIIVERIWVTGDVKPRRIERKFHDHYEDAAPEAWVPNDRTTIKIDENEADDLFVKFMMGN